MHYRARSYDPRLGRFIQMDPPRSRRAQHHYVYASNGPANFLDPLGLWTKKRSGGSRATAISEKGDTIEGLAKTIGLEASEYDSWLYPSKDFKIDQALPAGKEFGIPNVILVITSPAKLEHESKVVTERQLTKGVETARKMWGGAGFMVLRVTSSPTTPEPTTKKADVLKRLEAHTGGKPGDLQGFVYIGHGGYGSLILTDENGKDTDVQVADIKKALKYKLALAAILGCNTYASEWLRVVSSNGTAMGTRGLCKPWEFDALETIKKPADGPKD